MLPDQLIRLERRFAETELRRFFRRLRGEAKAAGQLTLDVYREFERTTLTGTHKRIRPLLAVLSYRMFGGNNLALARRAAISLELLHRFLLIHDDIIDHDAVRHGQLSIHEFFRRQLSPRFNPETAEHLGGSLALLAGDLAFDLALEAVASLPAPAGRRARVTKVILDAARSTVYGQTAELELTWRPRVRPQDARTVNAMKTVRYTLDAPLTVGAILAGAPASSIRAIGSIARPLGEAFQLKDDLIDLFGSFSVMGKPVGSDLREGKRTVLMLETLKRAPPRDRRFLERVLARRLVSPSILRRVRAIVRSSGAYVAVEEQINRKVRQGITALERLPSRSPGARPALVTLVKSLADRIY